MLTIRPMQPEDLPAVLALQAQAYAGAAFTPEGAHVYLDRMRLAPDLCLVAVDEGLLGYLVSHPWHDGLPPALDVALGTLPSDACCWYLHDCAADAQARGRGVAAALFEHARTAALARGLARGALTAVGEAAAYWKRLGYRPAALPGWQAHLAHYGSEAQYMTRVLGGAPRAAGVSSC